MINRHEGARRPRCQEQSRAYGGRQDGQGARREGDAPWVREDDEAVYGDKRYASDAKKRAAQEAGILWAVKEKRVAL